MFGYIWICLDTFGLCLRMLGFVWFCLDILGYGENRSDVFGCVLICLDLFGSVWLFLVMVRTGRMCLDVF